MFPKSCNHREKKDFALIDKEMYHNSLTGVSKVLNYSQLFHTNRIEKMFDHTENTGFEGRLLRIRGRFIHKPLQEEPTPAVLLIHQGKVQRLCDVESQPDVDIDFGHRVILPGMIDFHTHIARYPEYARDLLRWGITGIREAGTSWAALASYRTRSLRPDISSAGPLVDGPSPRWPHISQPLGSVKEIPKIIQDHMRNGADWIKAYYKLPPDILHSLIRLSHSSSLRVMGHLGLTVSWENAVRMGIDSLEHVRFGAVDHLLPRRLNERVANMPWPEKDILFWSYLNLQQRKFVRLLKETADRKVLWVPTLTVFRALIKARSPRYTALPTWHRERWRDRLTQIELTQTWKRRGRRVFPRILEAVTMARDLGVPILPGTDTPNLGLLPGLSYHKELSLLNRAGLPPVEILNIACFLPRQILGWPSPWQENASASFIVLDSERADRVSFLRQIGAVYHGSRWVFIHPRIAPFLW